MGSLLRYLWVVAAVLLCAGVSAMADQRAFSSRYYQIHTDIDSSLAADLARRMDAMYDEYARRLQRYSANPQRPMVEAFLFSDQDDYMLFVGPGMRSTGGAFMPARNALTAVLAGQGRDTLRRTLQHEAFHQFAYNVIEQDLPTWLNEGIAQYFEEGLWVGNGFITGQIPPRRVRQLQADIKAGRLMDFEKFMKMSPDTWAMALKSRSQSRGATQYNQAWAMVQYLLSANDPLGKPMRHRVVKMLDMIHDGKDADQAFAEAFSANYKGFNDRFLDWAGKLQATDEASYIEHMGVLGDMLVAMDGYGKAFGDIEPFRKDVEKAQLEIRYSKGQIKWSSGKDTNLYFRRLGGEPFAPADLLLQPRRGSPLPDIVCRCLPNIVLRTRFYTAGDHIEHELLIESSDPTTGRIMASPFLPTVTTPKK